MNGCGKETTFEQAYDIQAASYVKESGTLDFFAEDLCVTEDINYGTDVVNSQIAEGAGVFNLDTKEVMYSQNMFEKLYPASTTKILTAYIIIKNADLNAMVTVSESATNPGYGSSVCGLQAGDTVSVRDLLYGLLLVSGNDAAIALAEYYAGSAEAFADVMNREALALGATNSHFVNPSGYPDEAHYTTVYDMYLISQEAIKLDLFKEIIGERTIDVSYQNANGDTVSQTWTNTCLYLTEDVTIPDGITIIGGKTGTTTAAGYCLVLFSKNKRNEQIVSIIYKADGRLNLYSLMNEILSGFAN